MIKQETGFTLIELMIGLLLSSVLVAAIGRLFIDSGQNFKKQKTLSYLVEDGRYAQDIITKEFRRMGFLNNKQAINGTAADLFSADNNVLGSGINFASEEFVRGAYNDDGFGGDDFDINHIVFRYQLKDNTDLPVATAPFDASPCTRDIHLKAGEDPAVENHVVTLYFYVAFDDTLDTPTLYCVAKRENLADATKNRTSVAMPLISNVERMYILYGIDKTDDNYANQYLRADQLAANDWDDVVSIRVYLVLASEDTNVSFGTPSYSLDGRAFAVTSPNDKRIYRVFTTTIGLRNALL